MLAIIAAFSFGFFTVKPINTLTNRIQTNVEDKKIIKDTEQYARKYITDKYGFSPDVLKCNSQVENVLLDKNLSFSEGSSLEISAEYNGKKFNVSAYDIKKDAVPEFYDDFQSDFVKSSLEELVKGIDPGCVIIESNLYSEKLNEDCKNTYMFGSDDYIDTEKSAVLPDYCSGDAEILLPDGSHSADSISDLLSEHGIRCKLITFDRPENMYHFISDFRQSGYKPYFEYAPHIIGETLKDQSEDIVYTGVTHLSDNGEFKTAYFAEDKLYSNPEFTFDVAETESVIKELFKGKNGEEYLKKPVSKVYSRSDTIFMNNDDYTPRTMIYYPVIQSGKMVNTEKLAVLCCEKNNEDSVSVIKSKRIGDYAVFELPPGEIEFQICSI